MPLDSDGWEGCEAVRRVVRSQFDSACFLANNRIVDLTVQFTDSMLPRDKEIDKSAIINGARNVENRPSIKKRAIRATE